MLFHAVVVAVVVAAAVDTVVVAAFVEGVVVAVAGDSGKYMVINFNC